MLLYSKISGWTVHPPLSVSLSGCSMCISQHTPGTAAVPHCWEAVPREQGALCHRARQLPPRCGSSACSAQVPLG